MLPLLDGLRVSLVGEAGAVRDMPAADALQCEWIEADGLGGFASGTALGLRTRRYHALLLAAARPPVQRYVLVPDVEVWIERAGIRCALSSHVYEVDVIHPDAVTRLRTFSSDPWPRWTHVLADGTEVTTELVVPRGRAAVVLTWSASASARLFVRPRLAPRDLHGNHRANDAIAAGVRVHDRLLTWAPYRDVPAIAVLADATYRHDPLWFHRCALMEERARGLDHREDVLSPGELELELADRAVHVVIGTLDALESLPVDAPDRVAVELREHERERRSALGPLERARESYVVRRGAAPAIIAGYPWFGEWGRDTFIAMRGLCLATDRLDEAAALLDGWVDTVSAGMLPNCLPDAGDTPQYNAVDASLWFGIVVHELVLACESAGCPLAAVRAQRLLAAVDAVIDGYVAGTRHGIRVADDGLVAAGEPGVQLTWMDAKVGDLVVTPRIGKPVEVQALWLNLLALTRPRRPELEALRARGHASFLARFVADDRAWLADVVDVDHVAGRIDTALRPNQIYAVGGLPVALLEGPRARAVVDAVEAKLLTPLGLRSLAADDAAYVGHYGGGVRERDTAYHQGTVWPHLLGPFVDAWLRVHADEPDVRRRARARFLDPLYRHLAVAGLGHVSEIADADPPHTPRGAPFQAWGLGELLRLERLLDDA